jgi:hypothetical protein
MIDAKCAAAPRGFSCCRRAGHCGHCASIRRAAPLHEKLAGFAEDLHILAYQAERVRDHRHYEDLEEEAEDIRRGIRAAFRESTLHG